MYDLLWWNRFVKIVPIFNDDKLNLYTLSFIYVPFWHRSNFLLFLRWPSRFSFSTLFFSAAYNRFDPYVLSLFYFFPNGCQTLKLEILFCEKCVRKISNGASKNCNRKCFLTTIFFYLIAKYFTLFCWLLGSVFNHKFLWFNVIKTSSFPAARD